MDKIQQKVRSCEPFPQGRAPRRPPWRAAGLALALALAPAPGCEDDAPPPPPPAEARVSPPEPNAPTPTAYPSVAPRPLPEAPLARVDLPGLRALVAGQGGRPLVVHVWGNWGGPERELEALGALHQALGEEVAFLGVSGALLHRADTPETLDALKALLTAAGVAYPNVLFEGDARGLMAWTGAGNGLPATLVFGPEGALWARYERPVDGEDIRETLRVYGAGDNGARSLLRIAPQ